MLSEWFISPSGHICRWIRDISGKADAVAILVGADGSGLKWQYLKVQPKK